MLATLSIFFSEVSGFGFTLKARVDRAEEKAEAAVAESVEAKREARIALLATRYNEIRIDLEPGLQCRMFSLR